MSNINFPIDAVITWVDGSDASHKVKLHQYGNTHLFGAEDVAGDTRFAHVGEIFYCVASLYQYAPWLNKIYIVTDEQDPQLNNFILNHFPDRHIPIVIVDHKEIFQGYEQYLPTFNSISIESMTWRIPGLSEHYIEFNDDFFLAAPTTPEDFFTTDNRVVCYGQYRSSLYIKLGKIKTLYKRKMNRLKHFSFKEAMLNAAGLVGHKFSFIKIYHTPRPLLKSVFERFYKEHPHLLTQNIKHRFRHASQFTPQEVHYLLLHREHKCHYRRAYDYMLYMKANPKLAYNQEKLSLFDTRHQHIFACINSLDQASPESQKLIINWIEKRLHLVQPIHHTIDDDIS